jgi:hypothetical protein
MNFHDFPVKGKKHSINAGINGKLIAVSKYLPMDSQGIEIMTHHHGS